MGIIGKASPLVQCFVCDQNIKVTFIDQQTMTYTTVCGCGRFDIKHSAMSDKENIYEAHNRKAEERKIEAFEREERLRIIRETKERKINKRRRMLSHARMRGNKVCRRW